MKTSLLVLLMLTTAVPILLAVLRFSRDKIYAVVLRNNGSARQPHSFTSQILTVSSPRRQAILQYAPAQIHSRTYQI